LINFYAWKISAHKKTKLATFIYGSHTVQELPTYSHTEQGTTRLWVR